MDFLNNLNILGDISSNHHGERKMFATLYREIKDAGAIPKIQTFSPDTFPREWVDMLEPNDFVPSVFRPADIEFIMRHDPAAMKIASVENTYWDLIKEAMKTELPLIVSTGGMDEEDLFQLIDTVASHEKYGVILLHCTSLYPTELKDLNLGRITSLVEVIDDANLDLGVGWSSHYAYVNPKVLTMAYCFGSILFEVHVRHDLGFEHKATLDEQCALLPSEIKVMRGMLEDLAVIEGSENIVGPDRDFVVKHRSRWQATSPPSEG